MKTHRANINHGASAQLGRVLGVRAAGGMVAVSDSDGNEVSPAAEIAFSGAAVADDGNQVAHVTIGTGTRNLLNNSGVDCPQYGVVVNDDTADDAFTSTTTAGFSAGVVGVAQAAIAAGESGPILFSGYSPVLVDAAAVRGDFLETSTTAWYATTAATRGEGSFGVLLSGVDPADAAPSGLADLIIDSATTVATSAVTTMDFDMPATVPVGMLAVLQLILQAGASSPSISGWTRIGSTTGFRYYYRVTDGSETASYTVSWTGASKAVASVVILDGTNLGGPIAGYAYDATTAAAAVSGLADDSYLALAGVDANPATPAGWTPLAAGNSSSGGGALTASIVQQASAGWFGAYGGTITLPAPVTPGNLLILIETVGTWFTHNEFAGDPSSPGGKRPFTNFTPIVGVTMVYSTDARAKGLYRIATGDEQSLTFPGTLGGLHLSLYEVENAADPSTFEILSATHQAASGTKSLGSFSTPGDAQIMGFLWKGPSNQTVGAGWTQDSQTQKDSGLAEASAHATSGPDPQVSGAAYDWAGLAIGIVAGTVDVASELVAKLFSGTGVTSPFSGAGAQNDAAIALALAQAPLIELPPPHAHLWGGDPDAAAGGAGSVAVKEGGVDVVNPASALNAGHGLDVTDEGSGVAGLAVDESELTYGGSGDIAAEAVGSTVAAGAVGKPADAGHRHAMPSAATIVTALGVASCLNIPINGRGSVIPTGIANFAVRVKGAYTVTGWAVYSDLSGAATLNVWKKAHASYPPTSADSMIGSGTKPSTGSARKNAGGVGDWTGATTLVDGDVIIVNVDANATNTWLTLALDLVRTA